MREQALTILQLDENAAPAALERAYAATRARLERLTARGPLRFYRADLLTAAEGAYQQLRGRGTTRDDAAAKGPVRSTIKTGSILAGKSIAVRGRTLAALRESAADVQPKVDEQGRTTDRLANGRTVREQALVEDDFCREVIYRLEGDLLRFDSRRELLAIAEEKDIKCFRANMLMAQIVESVRRHGLFEQSKVERRQTPTQPRKAARWQRVALGTAVAVALAVAADVVLIRWLNR